MTTFIGIRGTAIQAVSSDPSNPETGQIWYNSSSGTLKGYQFVSTNAWSSAANLVNGSSITYRGSAGLQTAALAIGGYTSPGARSSATENYDGTAWASGGNLGTARYLHANLGTQTAALMATGNGPSPFPTSAEKYNGTTWTSAGNVSQGRRSLGGAGNNTAGMIMGGGNPSPISPTSNVENYNGSSWTTGTGLGTARYGGGGGGTQTAAIYFAGFTNPGPPNLTNATELWNGTSWTTSGNYPVVINASGFSGSQTAGIGFAGENQGPPYPYTNTNSWNGSTWTSLGVSMGNPRQYQSGSCGTQTAGLAVSSSPGSPGAGNSEEWTGTQLLVRTVTVS